MIRGWMNVLYMKCRSHEGESEINIYVLVCAGIPVILEPLVKVFDKNNIFGTNI